MSLGVIVGRFQVAELHDGHIDLIEYAYESDEDVLIILGEGHLKSVEEDPLTLEQRGSSILEMYPDTLISHISNVRTNEEWSKNLDKIIEGFNSDVDDVTLYGSRDSFIPHYSGKYRTEEVAEYYKVSATEKRAQVPTNGNKDYREGVIFGAKNRWVNAVPCVDVAIVDHGRVLLGRKPGNTEFQFIGGFVDTGESWEDAAHREVAEETGCRLRALTYISSYVVDDYRYKGKAKITTTLFSGEYMSGEPKAMDDIEEVKWFKLSGDIPIVNSHKLMLNNLRGLHRW